MKEIYKSKFLKILLHEWEALEFIFTALEMTENEFKNILQRSIALMKEYNIGFNIWDLTHFTYAIDPDFQEWIDLHINKSEIELGVTHEAFIVPSDLASQLSVEQSMDEIHGQHIVVRYFSNRIDAIDWLKSEIKV